VRIVAAKKTKKNKGKQKRPSKKSSRTGRPAERRTQARASSTGLHSSLPDLHVAFHPAQPASKPTRPVFSIEIGSIGGDTTIGDLIVAFPRTRDVLVKHGLRLDVEEAGYLYMTLNVFSAIHGLTSTSLVQELHAASKEPPPQLTAPQLRPVAAPPTP
jgi:hypothetical protein